MYIHSVEEGEIEGSLAGRRLGSGCKCTSNPVQSLSHSANCHSTRGGVECALQTSKARNGEAQVALSR